MNPEVKTNGEVVVLMMEEMNNLLQSFMGLATRLNIANVKRETGSKKNHYPERKQNEEEKERPGITPRRKQHRLGSYTGDMA